MQNTFFSAKVYCEVFLFYSEKCCPSVTNIFAKVLVIHEINVAICPLTHFSSLILYSLYRCMYVGQYVYMMHILYSSPKLTCVVYLFN